MPSTPSVSMNLPQLTTTGHALPGMVGELASSLMPLECQNPPHISLIILLAPQSSDYHWQNPSPYHQYLPSPSSKNKSSTSVFLSEFASYREILATHSGNLVIVGYFNLHLDNPNDPSVINFPKIIEWHGLVQHMKNPTHKNNHINDSGAIPDLTIPYPRLLGHQAVM